LRHTLVCCLKHWSGSGAESKSCRNRCERGAENMPLPAPITCFVRGMSAAMRAHYVIAMTTILLITQQQATWIGTALFDLFATDCWPADNTMRSISTELAIRLDRFHLDSRQVWAAGTYDVIRRSSCDIWRMFRDALRRNYVKWLMTQILREKLQNALKTTRMLPPAPFCHGRGYLTGLCVWVFV